MIPLSDLAALRVATWSKVPAPTGLGWLLSAFVAQTALLLAPPAVPLPTPRDRHLNRWRLLAWPLGAGPDAGTDPHILSTAQVLDALDAEHHDWVRHIMRGQVRDALAFGSVPDGAPQDEERARAASRRLVELQRDLAHAFPGEDWYRMPGPNVQTVEALMAQRPSVAPRIESGEPPALEVALWLRVVGAMLAWAVRRPKTRAALMSVVRVLPPLPKEPEVKEKLRRQLAEGCSDERLKTDEMLVLSH